MGLNKFLALLFILALTLSLATPSMAASSLPIPVQGAKTTINLTNGSSEEISNISFEKEEYSVLQGHERGFWELNVIVQYSDGSTDHLNYEDVNFTSSNNNIFIVEEYGLTGQAIGSAILTAEYKGRKATTNIRVVEPTSDVVIQLPGINQKTYADLWELQYLDEEYGDYYEYMDIQSQYNDSNNTLTIYGIDWSVEGPFIGYIQQGNRMYKITITQQDRGKTINLAFNESDYTLLTFNIPAKTDNLVLSVINLTAYDKQGNKISAGTFHDISVKNNQVYVPKDTYAMQITAEEGHDAYNLYTDKLNLTNQDHLVMFADEDIAKVSFNLEMNRNVQVEDAALCNWDYVNSCYSISTDSSIENIYTSKQDYSIFNFDLLVDNEWRYGFDREDTNVSRDQIISIDDQLKTELSFNQSSYRGGDRVYLGKGSSGLLQVKDSYGNKLSYIRQQGEKIPGILTFTKGTEVYKVQVENFSNPSVVLPNAEGTFEVTFTIGDGTTIPEPNPDDRVKPDVSGDWKEWTNNRIVANDYKWTIKFNDELKDASINGDNIFVVDQEGYLVKGTTVILSEDRKNVYVTAPDNGYKAGENYNLYINGNVESIKGKKLTSGIKMPFTIE